jgi:dipeptidyl aminopeptidase/acylaminoacyl peptidase
MKTRLCILLIATVSSLAAQAPQPASSHKRLITEKDLFEFVWVANHQLSPDGTKVAFTRVNCDEKRTAYETSIWVAPSRGREVPMRMTNGKHDAQPRWSPDGKYLVFVRAGEKDEAGKPKPSQFALLSLAGGEARTLTDLPKGASGAVWSPDGKLIAFASETTATDIQKAERKKKEESSAENEHESDVHVISRAIYRDNDEGYLDP